MDKINFLAKDDFPASSDTLDRLQKATLMVAALTGLGGVNYILSGCQKEGNQIAPGIIVLKGEILPFQGGTIQSKIAVQETKTQLEAFDILYPEAYIDRVAVFSDSGEYNWGDLVHILTNKELEIRISEIRGEPPGFKMEWTGRIDRIPENYMLADGRTLRTEDYPELAWFYGVENTESFQLPDMKRTFTVGYDGVQNSDYGKIGNTGGEEFHALTEDENGPHRHIVPWGENLNTAWKPDWGYPDDRFNNSRGYKAETDNDNTWPYTSPSGEGIPHENRPPFWVVGFLIKVKY